MVAGRARTSRPDSLPFSPPSPPLSHLVVHKGAVQRQDVGVRLGPHRGRLARDFVERTVDGFQVQELDRHLFIQRLALGTPDLGRRGGVVGGRWPGAVAARRRRAPSPLSPLSSHRRGHAAAALLDQLIVGRVGGVVPGRRGGDRICAGARRPAPRAPRPAFINRPSQPLPRTWPAAGRRTSARSAGRRARAPSRQRHGAARARTVPAGARRPCAGGGGRRSRDGAPGMGGRGGVGSPRRRAARWRWRPRQVCTPAARHGFPPHLTHLKPPQMKPGALLLLPLRLQDRPPVEKVRPRLGL